MTEAPSPVFFAEAKPESKVVTSVKRALNKWFERVGPKGIENRFVKAHENVLATLDSEQRKEVFAKEAEKWRKIGKIMGIAATAIDFLIIGMGIDRTYKNLRTPALSDLRLRYKIADDSFNGQDSWIKQAQVNILTRIYNTLYGHPPSTIYGGTLPTDISLTPRELIGDRIASSTPALRSLVYFVGMGPAHITSHGTALLAEQLGKFEARTKNYVDSGKAAEHAAKVGNAVGNATKYAIEHQEDISKAAKSVQELQLRAQQAKEEALKREYQRWRQSRYENDKAYYDMGGSENSLTYETFMKEKAQQETKKNKRS